MSYDLFLRSPTSVNSSAEFDRYFSQRQNFSMKNGQAWYQNEDTGVYFSFELAEAGDETPACWVHFNVNYARPRFFILEALPQVQSFVSTFGLTVLDPQIDGMGDGRFDPDGFIRGWEAGNEFGCLALAGTGHPRPPTMPAELLNAAWQWNIDRQALQARVGEAAFVPQIMFVASKGSALSAAVWSDAIPVLLPTVDVIFLYRDAYAPRRFFRRKPDVTFLEWDAVEPVVQGYPVVPGPVPYRRLEYLSPPTPIATLFSQTAASVPRAVVAADSILESELVARVPEWRAAD